MPTVAVFDPASKPSMNDSGSVIKSHAQPSTQTGDIDSFPSPSDPATIVKCKKCGNAISSTQTACSLCGSSSPQ